MRRVILSLFVCAFGVGCTASPSSTSSPFATKTFSPSPIPFTPLPEVLPQIVLSADLSEEPVSWDRVTFIPLGNGPDELGLIPAREAPPIGPNSFAVDQDGSFWIIDAANRRVAHFAKSGQLLGEIEHSVRSVSRDLAFVGSTLFVVAYSNKGVVFSVTPEGDQGLPGVVTDNGRVVRVSSLIPTSQGLFAEITGHAETPGEGPTGIYSVELPGSGHIQEVPGLPLRNGDSFQLYERGSQDFDLNYLDGDRQTVQPLRIKVLSSKPYGNQTLDGPVGLGDFVLDGNDVYMWVQMSVSKPDGSGDQLGGRFLLRVGESPVLFERLPDATNEDETQVRHIALGPDGHIYLMYIGKTGVTIYRR